MFAVDEAEARGRRIGTFLRRQDGPNLNRVRGPELFAASKSDRKTGLRLMGVPREGAEFPVEISVDVTRDRLPICVCVIRDISHQIAVEAALKESRDRALAGERAKARFLGVVSHEMRTPLNGIMGTIDLIDEDAAKPGATAKDITQNYLPVLRGSSETLLNLVNDVLDITQIEGGVRISKAPFDLDSLIENLAANETARARDQGNTIDIIIDKPTGSVMGDGARIRQVLSNLISNAVKFTRNGRVTIEVTHHPKDQVEIQVIDTGMGMSEADLARVFDDFTRTDRAVEAQIQGTGLGLGIARTLVEAMEGEIGVESEEGEGSLFWVRLPLPPSADQTAEPAPSESTQNEPCPIPACHVLVVEDNGTNRFIARRLLENDGHSVVEAADGQAGLDAALNQKFDLILMDISMPIMDGIEAAKRIRATPGPNQSTRIVALTAHLSGGYGRQGDMSVMDHILHKPLQRDALRDDLARACGIVDCPGPKPVEPARIAPQSPIDELIASTDPATAQRLIRAFIDEADSTLPDLKTRTEALEDRPNMRLAEDLHALGGVAASFGARSLHLALIQAETAERSGHYEKSAELVAEAADIWPDVRRELQSKLPA
jgi:signal transduction histidine kinase/CheY-like chemotaxis protein/HPt (histidine-containing phosphotransfer) domain-containing protein